jgi:hypothetical protein
VWGTDYSEILHAVEDGSPDLGSRHDAGRCMAVWGSRKQEINYVVFRSDTVNDDAAAFEKFWSQAAFPDET